MSVSLAELLRVGVPNAPQGLLVRALRATEETDGPGPVGTGMISRKNVLDIYRRRLVHLQRLGVHLENFQEAVDELERAECTLVAVYVVDQGPMSFVFFVDELERRILSMFAMHVSGIVGDPTRDNPQSE